VWIYVGHTGVLVLKLGWTLDDVMLANDAQDDDDVDVAEASSVTKLDSCTVQVDPPMTAATERLRLPENLMKQLSIVADMTPTGLVLTGENSNHQAVFLLIYGEYLDTLNTRHFVVIF